MTEQTEEQKELEEQAIALKWQSDVRWLRKTLKFEEPENLSALRGAQYFAEEYLPRSAYGQSLSDAITASFIQDLPYSGWQTGAMRNVKKFLPDSQNAMLQHWMKEKKKLSKKGTAFPKNFVLSHLGVARIYAMLDDGKQVNSSDSQMLSPLKNDTLLSLAHALPFFDETPTWSENAQRRFSRVLVQHISRNIAAQSPQKRANFVVGRLAQTTIPEQNPKRTLFMIKMLGHVCDTFGDKPDRQALDIILKNLTNQGRLDAVRQIRVSFHLDPEPPRTLSLFKFFKRSK